MTGPTTRRFHGAETSRTCKMIRVTRVSAQTANSPRNGTEKSSSGSQTSPIVRPLGPRLAVHEDAKVPSLDVIYQPVDAGHDVRRVAVLDDGQPLEVFDLQPHVLFDKKVQPLLPGHRPR